VRRRYLVADDRIGLRHPGAGDAEEYVSLALASRALHHPWLSTATDADAFRAYLRRCRRRDTQAFLVHERAGGRLCGFVHVTNIVGGAFQSGYVGYAAFAGCTGQGYLTDGLALAIRYAFGRLGLHRLEANIQPANEPSRRLAERCGFRLEGYSPAYLFIDGAWRDHERWAITAEMI
jgi:ribosomal-protein-alanine N-acetyltransferase